MIKRFMPFCVRGCLNVSTMSVHKANTTFKFTVLVATSYAFLSRLNKSSSDTINTRWTLKCQLMQY